MNCRMILLVAMVNSRHNIQCNEGTYSASYKGVGKGKSRDSG